MNILAGHLANIDIDNTYSILEVLKDTPHSRIEKVSQNNHLFIRKYYSKNCDPNSAQTIGELTALSRLRHISLPRIEHIYDLPNKIVIIEEHIDGIDLHSYVRQKGKMSPVEGIHLTIQICEIVTFLHAQNPPIIHRNIKPDNIIYTGDNAEHNPTGENKIKLINFSIAGTYDPRKGKDTVFVGTVGYAPPEQYGFGQTDMRSDIYSIGMTLFYMLTGSEPERSLDASQIALLPHTVQQIILKSTDFAPDARYPSVQHMMQELKRAHNILSTPEPVTDEAGMPLTNLRKYEPLWDAWYIDSLLGKGSFGEVWRAHRDIFGKTCYSAIKIISVPSDEAEIRQMRNDGYDDASLHSFLQALLMDLVSEIDLMNGLRGNSHIVSFEDYKVIEKAGGIGWDLLIRMELLTSLADHALQHPLSADEVTTLGIHICKALELCAQKNIIHRDIKPDNIFISQYGDYKLGDFGIARHLEHTMDRLSIKGTYTYMAPEVLRGEPYGTSVDTYSLGIVMYRLLNQGRPPFLPDSPQIVMPSDRETALQRRMNGESIPPLKNVNPALNSIVLKACAYNRDRRFGSPTEMRGALEDMAKTRDNASSATTLIQHIPDVRPVQNQSSAVPEQTTNSPARLSKKRKRVLWSAILCATVLLVSCVTLFVNTLLHPAADPTNDPPNTTNTNIQNVEKNENTEAGTPDPQGNKYNKHVVTPDQFQEKIRALGYSVADNTLLFSLTGSSHIVKALQTSTDDPYIDFFEFKTVADSVSSFNSNKQMLGSYKLDSSVETTESDGNYQKYTLTQTRLKRYYVLIQLETTFLYIYCDESDPETANNIVKELGY